MHQTGEGSRGSVLPRRRSEAPGAGREGRPVRARARCMGRAVILMVRIIGPMGPMVNRPPTPGPDDAPMPSCEEASPYVLVASRRPVAPARGLGRARVGPGPGQAAVGQGRGGLARAVGRGPRDVPARASARLALAHRPGSLAAGRPPLDPRGPGQAPGRDPAPAGPGEGRDPLPRGTRRLHPGAVPLPQRRRRGRARPPTLAQGPKGPAPPRSSASMGMAATRRTS
jgi:hypothetical protein